MKSLHYPPPDMSSPEDMPKVQISLYILYMLVVASRKYTCILMLPCNSTHRRLEHSQKKKKKSNYIERIVYI